VGVALPLAPLSATDIVKPWIVVILVDDGVAVMVGATLAGPETVTAVVPEALP
jgi:hypothetical protein